MSEQSRPELQQLYNEGKVEDIGAWIERSIAAFKTAHPDFNSSRLVFTIINGTYPQEIRSGIIHHQLTGVNTVTIAYLLGYIAGALGDSELSSIYETVHMTLESMRFHYGMQYGLTHFGEDTPHFVVRVPNDPKRYLDIRIAPKAAVDPIH
jgi:hypothetical protein